MSSFLEIDNCRSYFMGYKITMAVLCVYERLGWVRKRWGIWRPHDFLLLLLEVTASLWKPHFFLLPFFPQGQMKVMKSATIIMKMFYEIFRQMSFFSYLIIQWTKKWNPPHSEHMGIYDSFSTVSFIPTHWVQEIFRKRPSYSRTRCREYLAG